MKRFIRAAINNIDLTSNFKSRVIDLIRDLPEEQHENALAILLGATEDIYLGEVKVERGKQPTDTNYQTIDFNHLTQTYTVQYKVRKEINVSHNFTPEDWQNFKEMCLNFSTEEILSRLGGKGTQNGWVKTGEWEPRTKLVSKYEWEKHYNEVI